MNIYKMKKEELELLSYTDMAYEILRKSKECKSTVGIFKEIASLLEMSEDEYAATIGDFYTTLTTDKRFLALANGQWDLKERHSTKIVIDDEDDFEIELDDDDKTIDEPTKEEENLDYDANDDFDDNGLEDLVVVDEDDKFDE